MTDQPEAKPNPLDATYPDRYKRVCVLLDKYIPGSRLFSVADDPSQPSDIAAINEFGNPTNPFSLLKSALIAYAQVDQFRKELKIKYQETIDDEAYLFCLIDACKKPGFFGGYSSYTEYLNSEYWQQVRGEAIERAGSRCMLCNRNDLPLHVHHRTYERLGCEEPMDVIVLCSSDHAKFHGKDGTK